MQAELEFGLEQSKDIDHDEILSNLGLFLDQSKEWAEADSSIISLREELSQEVLPGTDNLKSAVLHEIDYQYAMWNGDFATSLESCRKVIAELSHSDLRGYRALWNYLAGSSAWLCTKESMGSLEAVAREYFGTAMSAAHGVRWLVRLSKSQDEQTGSIDVDSTNALSTILIERLESVLESLGTLHDRKYAQEEKFIFENIMESDSKKFEAAQEKLGWLLGFESGNDETSGAPDPWWMVDESLCVVFEDHSNAESGSSLHVKKARQAFTHPNWIKKHLVVAEDAEIITVLVTPVKVADKDALPHLQNVCLWNVEDFREWSQKALTVVRELRKTFPGSGDLAWRATAIEAYAQNEIDPRSLVKMLKSNLASELLKP